MSTMSTPLFAASEFLFIFVLEVSRVHTHDFAGNARMNGASTHHFVLEATAE
jgi:hypothetical protein